MSTRKGNIETVMGSKELSQIGKTLTHEHVSLDFTEFYVPPPNHLERFLEGKIHLRNVGYVKQYPYSNKFNLVFNDTYTADAVLEDIKVFHESGGGTIVENSTHGLKRNIPLMKRISEETGVNIIAGTGYYVAAVQSASTLNMTTEALYDTMFNEMTIGCKEYPSVKAGFIGEVGISWPIADFEKRVIRAAAEVQAQLRCAVSFHPGRDSSSPLEILRIYEEAGGDSERANFSHLDRTLDANNFMEFVDATDSFCQFDLFGVECSYYQLNPLVNMPSDAQRMERIKILKDESKLHRVLISHDIHTKHRLTSFGGHGYAHIINNVLPKMTMNGFSTNDIDMLTTRNPAMWLMD